jgi:hypothetical protein
VQSREQDRCTSNKEGRLTRPFLTLSSRVPQQSYHLAQSRSPAPPHRTGRKVLPYPALRCSSSTSVHVSAWLCGIASSEVLELGRTAVLAQKGTRSSYPLWTCEQSNAPSLPSGCVVLIINTTMGVSDSSTERPFPLRWVTVYRVGYVGCHPTTRRGLPSSSTHSPNIPCPIHRRVPRRCISKSFHAFCCLHHHHAGFGSLLAR